MEHERIALEQERCGVEQDKRENDMALQREGSNRRDETECTRVPK